MLMSKMVQIVVGGATAAFTIAFYVYNVRPELKARRLRKNGEEIMAMVNRRNEESNRDNDSSTETETSWTHGDDKKW